MIKAVIWDFGGVFTSSPFEAFARYENERGIPVGTIRKINSTNPEANAWAQFEQSKVDIDGFDKLFLAEAAVLGHTIPGRDVLPLLAGDFRPDVIEALRRVKLSGLLTGCITNNMPHNAAGGTAAGRSLYSQDIMKMFDVVIESAKIGIRKPNPEIYKLMCKQLGVEPNECVFLDDLGPNLKPAKAMGMITIKVESGPQAIKELEAATGLKLH
ncbi:MAG: HAD-IA family hydrolase [Alphaproteobacteria bacterium]|nr:HAD-IA family hydrolase [Alphaproteobacteria bacterium]MBV9903041.1 HAD-IA family hydrolase [Alphaproteobacteria bacterium]